MIYVLDTSAIGVLSNYYPATFGTLWGLIEAMADEGTFVSVREVLNELENWSASDFIQDWARRRRALFATPSPAEQAAVARILAVPHFQQIIGTQAMLKGTPVADPFVIAAAMVAGGAVVTQEKLKPNAAKIPNVCAHFGVPYCDVEGFMRQQGWVF